MQTILYPSSCCPGKDACCKTAKHHGNLTSFASNCGQLLSCKPIHFWNRTLSWDFAYDDKKYIISSIIIKECKYTVECLCSQSPRSYTYPFKPCKLLIFFEREFEMNTSVFNISNKSSKYGTISPIETVLNKKIVSWQEPRIIQHGAQQASCISIVVFSSTCCIPPTFFQLHLRRVIASNLCCVGVCSWGGMTRMSRIQKLELLLTSWSIACTSPKLTARSFCKLWTTSGLEADMSFSSSGSFCNGHQMNATE